MSPEVLTSNSHPAGWRGAGAGGGETQATPTSAEAGTQREEEEASLVKGTERDTVGSGVTQPGLGRGPDAWTAGPQGQRGRVHQAPMGRIPSQPLKPLQGAGAALSPTAMTKPTGAQRRSVPGVPQLGRAQGLSWAARSYLALR